MRVLGHEFTRELNNAVMGRPPQACFEEMIRWHSLDDSWEELAAESEELFLAFLDNTLAPMPGLVELLDRLEAAGIPKAICTSSARRLLVAILSRFEMEPRFQFTLTSEDITQGKPHPEIYEKAAQFFGLDPHEMLVLEDSATGSLAAARAGAFVVAVPSELSCDQDFGVASLVLDSLAHPRLYQSLGL